MDRIFYVGVVESRKDPTGLGRLKVRVFSVHDENPSNIPTSALPWARTMNNGSSLSGIGSSPKYIEGDWVILFFLDGNLYQRPFVIGSIPAITEGSQFPFGDPSQIYPLEEYLNESDVARLARGPDRENDKSLMARKESRTTGITTSNGTWDQPIPENEGESVYPLNSVHTTESGMVIELDDSPEATRIHVYHPSGSFVEITNKGERTDRTEGDRFDINVGNHNTATGGDYNLTIGGNANVLVHGDVVTEVQGNRKTIIHGNDHTKVNGDVIFESGGTSNIHGEGGLTVTTQNTLSMGAQDIVVYARGSFGGSSNEWGVKTVTWSTEASGNAKINASRIDLN